LHEIRARIIVSLNYRKEERPLAGLAHPSSPIAVGFLPRSLARIKHAQRRVSMMRIDDAIRRLANVHRSRSGEREAAEPRRESRKFRNFCSRDQKDRGRHGDAKPMRKSVSPRGCCRGNKFEPFLNAPTQTQQRDGGAGAGAGAEGGSIIHADGNRFYIHELPAYYALHFRRNTVNGTYRRRYRDYRRNSPPRNTRPTTPAGINRSRYRIK
jgi:hypothetical protein